MTKLHLRSLFLLSRTGLHERYEIKVGWMSNPVRLNLFTFCLHFVTFLSSAAVFTRQNPFPPDPPLSRSHYSPSRSRKIPKQQKRLVRELTAFTLFYVPVYFVTLSWFALDKLTAFECKHSWWCCFLDCTLQALSPVLFTEPPSPSDPPTRASPLRTEDQVFHERSRSILLCPPPTECLLSYSESWPSTDLSCSTDNINTSACSEAQMHAMRNMVAPTIIEAKEPSVLAK